MIYKSFSFKIEVKKCHFSYQNSVFIFKAACVRVIIEFRIPMGGIPCQTMKKQKLL